MSYCPTFSGSLTQKSPSPVPKSDAGLIESLRGVDCQAELIPHSGETGQGQLGGGHSGGYGSRRQEAGVFFSSFELKV